MALIEKISSSDLYHMACRMDRGHNFGYAGWNAIGEYLEQLSEDISEDVEVDIVAICCEYSSADSVDEFYNEWRSSLGFSREGLNINTAEIWEDMDEEEKLEAIRDYLQENTSIVVCEENLIIWQAF